MTNKLKTQTNFIIKLMPVIMAISMHKYLNDKIAFFCFKDISKTWFLISQIIISFMLIIATLIRIGVMDELENGYEDEETKEIIKPTNEMKQSAKDLNTFGILYLPINTMFISALSITCLNEIHLHLTSWKRADLIYSYWNLFFIILPILSMIIFIFRCSDKTLFSLDENMYQVIKKRSIIIGLISIILSVISLIALFVFKKATDFPVLELQLLINILFTSISISKIKSKINQMKEKEKLKELASEGIE